MSVARKVLMRWASGMIAMALAASFAAAQVPVIPTGILSTKTMQNLQRALNGERNAHSRYLVFAEKADQEGYGAVASLFRAVAAAEETHANNHEQTIRDLGGTPDVKLESPEVKTTRENLEAAIKGESYEYQTMYPGFINEARTDRYAPALVTLTQAKNTEVEHARLFSEALNNLDGLKGSSARTYYVCTVCGFTTVDLNFEKCRNCFKPKEKYKAVS